MRRKFISILFMSGLLFGLFPFSAEAGGSSGERPRVIVLTDGEIDDECSLVRFLLYTNEWDVEAIVTTSSQYHWLGYKWAGNDWLEPYLATYEQVYPNLVKHDPHYPSPAYLRDRAVLGNIRSEGEMEEMTPGAKLIEQVLLDATDPRPVWIQAWGGTNTLARALKEIEEYHPERMAEVASKLRLFLIWEQDATYQDYILPHWGRYDILTIISDQFITYFYHWKKYLPDEQQHYLSGTWMRRWILEGHGPLCALYKAHENGDFRSEGDSPAFFHIIPTGLNNAEHPDWGGWGGRYVRVRGNTWLDPVPETGYRYPEGRWFTDTAWGRVRMRKNIPGDSLLRSYLRPTWKWLIPLQQDFAARADWCVKSWEEANHAPQVYVRGPLTIHAQPGDRVPVSVEATDPDNDTLRFHWWVYDEAGSSREKGCFSAPDRKECEFIVPESAPSGKTLHLVCSVSDEGTPSLTRYARVVITIE